MSFNSSRLTFQGNPDVHVILRGGSSGPNYAAEFVRDCGEKLIKAGFPPKIMVSTKRHTCIRARTHCVPD